MKTIIRKTDKAYRNMKRVLADPQSRDDLIDLIEGAAGFAGMFVILFALTVMF